MKRITSFNFWIVLIFMTTPCSAVSENPLSISELIDMALQNNPKTKKAWWKAKCAEANVGLSTSSFYPDIALNTTAAHGRDFKFINGPDTNYTIIGADLALSLMLYDFGERESSINSAKMALQRAQWNLDLSIQKVVVAVLENIYQLAHEEEVLKASKLSLDDASQMLEISKKLYHAGLNPVSDVYIAKSAYFLMQMEAAKRKGLLDIQQGTLANSLGLTFDTPLNIAPIPLPLNENLHLNELQLLAESKRADVMSKRAEVQEAIFHLDKVKAEYKPRISLNARGGYDHAVHDKAQGAHYQIVLNFDVPLFNGFKSFYEKNKANASLMSASEDLEELLLNISLEVLTFSLSVKTSAEMLFYAEENLQNAKKAYTGTLDKYQIGEESIAELSYAQKQLAAARILYSDIKTHLLVSIANLAFATGSLCIE